MKTRLFTEHLEELRLRIIKSLAAVILFTLGVSFFHEHILVWLIKPVEHLYFISPQEALTSRIKICLWGGFFCSFPYVMFQVWQFLTAGLLEQERRYLKIFIPASIILFYGGILMAFTLVVPVGLDFLLQFSTDTLIPMITVSHYISFLSGMMLAFGLVFQLPIVLAFLAKCGFIRSQTLRAKRRHAIVLIFIAAAVLSPPDIVTQLALAVPLILLYEVSIWAVRCSAATH